MSLSNTTVKSISVGNGSNKTFAIPFTPIVDDSAETKVYMRDETDTSNITTTLLEEGEFNDYTLTGAPDADSFHVNVQLTTSYSAPTSSQYIIIARVLPLTQTMDMSVVGFRPPTVEEMGDRLCAMIQQLDEKLSRTPALGITERETIASMEIPDPIDGYVLTWKADGTGFEWQPPEGAIGPEGPQGPTGNSGSGIIPLLWKESSGNAPTYEDTGVPYYVFDAGLAQELTCTLLIPAMYTAGKIIGVKAKVLSADTSGTLLFKISGTLVREGVDLITTVANVSISPNTAITLSAGTANIPQEIDFVLASAGLINSIAVSPGDLIKLKIYRDTDTSTGQAKLLVGSEEAYVNTGSFTGITEINVTAPIASTGGASPTISLNDTAVTPGSYTYASITVDQKGRLTAAGNGSAPITDHTGLSNIGTNTHAQIDTHIANTSNPHSVTKSQVGLSNVDNTTDLNKPISTATQTALDLKAPIANPTFTGTVSGVTASMVGLGNVDNTSDATKNAAVATLTNKTLTAPVINSPTGIVKGDVGLGNVDNTTDLNKPISTATQTALDLKAPIASPTFTGTVSGITKTMVGLGNVDNTSDVNKPVSTAQQTAIDAKVSDTAYDATSWNGVTTIAPSKNAVRDQLEALIPATSVISASAIDWSTLLKTGGLYTKTLSANTTFTFSNRGSGQTIVVRLTNTASNYTVTWPTVKWAGGTTPTMTVGAKSDVYTFIFDGTDVFGSYVQNF